MLIKKEEKMMIKRKKKGFTLIELIVVIAILGILAAIAVPKFAGFQGKANAKATLSTLSTLNTAAQTYASDNNVAITSVTQSNVLAALGWTAMPTSSPKGITYSWTTGDTEAKASVAAGTPWPADTSSALTGVTADTIKAY